MSLDSNVFWIVTLSVCGVIVLGFTIFARHCSFSPAVSYGKLEQLRVGMNRDDVTALLGAPRDRRAGEDRAETWVYGARWKRHVLVLQFNGESLQTFVHAMPNEQRGGTFKED
jgi:hypothetical protein